MTRIVLFAAGMVAGVVAMISVAGWTGWPHQRPGTASAETSHAVDDKHSHADEPRRVALSEQQISDAGVTTAQAKGGTLNAIFSHRAR